MRDLHNGTATFTWETKPEDAGIHNLRVAVFDDGGGGEELTDITIAICNRMLEDGDIDGVLAATFGHAPDVPAVCRGADSNGDGVVNAADLVMAG